MGFCIVFFISPKKINKTIPYLKNFFKGRKWQRRIAEMRPEESTTIEDVYKLDNELYDWWMRTDYKDNQR